MDVRITIDDRESHRAMRKAPAQVKQANRAAMNDTTALLLRDLSTYPPARPESDYTRTRTLGRSWNRRITVGRDSISGFVGSNENIAPYNRYVQDAERQARMHKATWTNTVQNVRERRQAAIQQMFQTRLRQFVR